MSVWVSAWLVTGWDYENSFCDSLYGFALPSRNLKPTQKAPLQDEHSAGLASYGHGYLQPNAHNCLSMALRRGGSPNAASSPGAWGYPHRSSSKGGYIGEVAMKKIHCPAKDSCYIRRPKIFAGWSRAWHLSVNECMFLILIVIIIITVIMMINSWGLILCQALPLIYLFNRCDSENNGHYYCPYFRDEETMAWRHCMVYSKPRAGRWQSWASGPLITLRFIACVRGVLLPHGMAGGMTERMDARVLFTHRAEGGATCYFLLEGEVVSLGMLASSVPYCYYTILMHTETWSCRWLLSHHW